MQISLRVYCSSGQPEGSQIIPINLLSGWLEAVGLPDWRSDILMGVGAACVCVYVCVGRGVIIIIVRSADLILVGKLGRASENKLFWGFFKAKIQTYKIQVEKTSFS